MNGLQQKLKPFLNFYLIVGLIAFVWMLFFDLNNVMDRMKRNRRIAALEADLELYEREKQELQDSRSILETDVEEFERFARERYHMKKADEDLFLIVEPSEP